MTTLFHQRLEKLGIPSVTDDYGPGTHSWPYWARDLRESIGPVTAALTHPVAAPRTFDYTSADASFGQYGWHVAVLSVPRGSSPRWAPPVQGASRWRRRSRLGHDGAALPPPYAIPGRRHGRWWADAAVYAHLGRSRRLPDHGLARVDRVYVPRALHGGSMSGPRIRPGTPAEIGRINTLITRAIGRASRNRPPAEPVHDARAPARSVPRLADVRRAADARRDPAAGGHRARDSAGRRQLSL